MISWTLRSSQIVSRTTRYDLFPVHVTFQKPHVYILSASFISGTGTRDDSTPKPPAPQRYSLPTSHPSLPAPAFGSPIECKPQSPSRSDTRLRLQRGSRGSLAYSPERRLRCTSILCVGGIPGLEFSAACGLGGSKGRIGYIREDGAYCTDSGYRGCGDSFHGVGSGVVGSPSHDLNALSTHTKEGSGT